MVDSALPAIRATVRPSEWSVARRRGPVYAVSGVVAIALLLLAPAGLQGGLSPPRSGSSTAPSDGHPTGSATFDTALPPPSLPLSAGAPPSGVGSGANAVLATLDLVHGDLAPGTDNHTMNGVAPLVSAYDPEKQAVYVASESGNYVQVVNATSHEVSAIISVPGGPTALVYDPAGHEVFAADYYSNNLSVINDTTDTVVGTIPVPSGIANVVSAPVDLLYDPLNQTVLVAQYGGYVCCTDNITVVNGITNRIAGEIPAPPGVISLAYNPSNHLLYALSRYGLEIGVTNLATGASVENMTPAGPSGYYTGIAIDPQSGLLYLTSTDFGAYVNVTAVAAGTGVTQRNTTLLEPGAQFGYPTPVYSNATQQLYVTGYTGELFTLTGSSGALLTSVLDGLCLGPVTLTVQGAPYMMPDTCGGTLLWLAEKTGEVSTSSVVGAAPTQVQQVPSTGDVAVLETGTQRLDLLDPSTGAVSESIGLAGSYGSSPAASAVDVRTGWLYFYDFLPPANTLTGPLVAYDTDAQAVLWTYPDCLGCVFDGLGDSNGTLYLDVIETGSLSVHLVELNATTGSVKEDVAVGSYASWSDLSVPQMGVEPIPGTTLVGLGDLPRGSTIVFNNSSATIVWSFNSSAATGPQAYLPLSNLLVVGSVDGSGNEFVVFLNASTGEVLQTVPIPFVATSIAPGGGSTQALVLEGGYVLTLSVASGAPIANITVPEEGGYTGLFPLATSGGVALPSSTYGAVYWIGASLNITGFAAVGPTVQGESLSLQANVTGGYGTETFAYTGLPAGCASSGLPTLSCVPLVAGAVTVRISGNDSTGLPGPAATLALTLSPFPLAVNVSSPTSYFLSGTSTTFAATLAGSEAGIAPYVNYSWSIHPASAGTLNRTNASTVTVTWAGGGSAQLVLTADLRGTEAQADLNVSVLASSSTSSFLGLSSTETLLFLVVVAVLVVVVVVAIVARRRGGSESAPSPPPDEPEPVEEAPPMEPPPPEA
jgi:YVTN family beta-propeller protein